MRAAGIVLGALGLFGTRVGELNQADLLVGQTLTHVACVAILQEHTPTPATVLPRLRTALTNHVIVEQAKGLLREQLGVSIEEAFNLLRTYARANGEHLSNVARRLMTDRDSRPALVGNSPSFLARRYDGGLSGAGRGRAARPPPPTARRPRLA